MKIKVLTYHKGFVEADIPEDFVFLRVTQMTGDEIIEVYCRDEEWGDSYLYEIIDPDYENRTRNFFDCTYIVTQEQLEFWNDRDKGYHRWNDEDCKKFLTGFVDGDDLSYQWMNREEEEL